MRKGASAAPICILVFAIAGCGGNGDAGEESSVELSLSEQNGSGQSGRATLTEFPDGRTQIVMELSNPPAVEQPAHVHPGPCEDLGPPVAPLTSVLAGRSETVVGMSFDDLRRGGLVVHAHKSAKEFDTSVACAEIPRAD
jgi:hypothetical protein